MHNFTRQLLLKCSGLYSLALIACLFGVQFILPEAKAPTPTDYHSLRSIRARIGELTAQEKDKGEEKERPKPAKENESLDYLEALEAYLAPRAYPNDTVDWAALKGAAQKRDRMAAYKPLTSLNNWVFLGPNNCASPSIWAFGPGKVSGRVASAAFDPVNPGTMYIASAGGGAWKTLDGGITWKPLGDTWSNIPTSCVAVDPQNTNVVYVGTGDWDGWGGYSQGIEKSIDGGNTWTNLGNAEFGNFAVRRILIDPDNDQILTIVASRGAQGDGKVWRSSDGGLTWTAVITAPTLWSDIVCTAADNTGARAYYAVAGGTSSQLWKSIDRGVSWTKLTTPMRTGVSSYDTADIAASPTAPATIYLLGTGNTRLWKSTNGGGTWTNITGPALASADWGQSWYDFYVTCSTNGTSDVLYVGLIDVLQSPDGGSTWESFMNGYTGIDLAHVDEHDFIIDPNNPNHALACNDGGVYNVQVSGINGAFTSLNSALGITEFYYGDFHPTDGSRMIGGAQDDGSPGSLGNLANWGCVTGGDGGVALINQTNPNIQYSTYQYFGGAPTGGTIGFNRTGNNWATFNWVSVDVGSDMVSWMGPAVMAATDSDTVYVATNYLWKYTDSLNSWTPRLGNQLLSATSTISSIGVTKADRTILYTGSYDGQLFMSRNSGSNWTQINGGAIPLPNRSYTAISVRDNNANDVLVGLSGTGADHLWRCFDTSAGARSWVDVSGTGITSLPDVPVNALARDPLDPTDIWYAGTDVGVFRTADAGSTWQNITQPLGLPNVQINGLTIRNDFLCAVTYGRGMWTLDLAGFGGGGGNLSLTSLGLNPSAVVGPNPSTGTIVISGPAPQGGTSVSLSSTNPGVASVPSTVTVPAGETSVTFSVTTTVVPTQTTATISASLNGTSATADLTVNPDGLTNMVLNPTSVIGGNSSIGTVTIATPATGSGAIIHLSSSNTAVAQVPTTVIIANGQSVATFTVSTTPTSADSNSTITATFGTSSVQAQLTVTAATTQSLTLSLSTVVGGNPVQGTVTLSGRAPAGGAVIALASSATSVATVPATVTIPSGASSANFTVTTVAVSVDSGVTISGTYHSVLRQATVLVSAQHIAQLALTPNPAVGGNTVQGRVTLAGPSAGQSVIQLSSTNTNLATVPVSVSIANGQTSAPFTVTTRSVTSNSQVNIFAVLGGSSQEASLSLMPLQISGFTLSSNSVFERSTVVGTVTLDGPALAGGAVVQISNSNSAAATMPSTLTIPQGSTSKTFTITAQSVTSVQVATITVTRNGVSRQQTLSVTPIALQSIQLSLNSVIGGTSVNGVVRIGAPAPTGGYVVHLTSSYPTIVKVPATVTIARGSLSATFVATTLPVPQTYFATVTATHNSSTVSTQLQVVPPEVSTFRVSPTSVRGGSHVTGTVILTGKAPTGGMVIQISANPNLASPLTTVKVAAGSTSVNFTIGTSHVVSTTSVTLTAIALNIQRSAVLTLTP